MQFHTTGIVLAALTVVSAASAQSTQAVEWKVSEGGNGHWYRVYNSLLAWPQASQFAFEHGGHLVTESNAAEKDFVWSVASPIVSPQPFWIGAFQPSGSCEPGCGWRWVTEESFGYTNWKWDEPNNNTVNGNEDAICTNGSNLWNDLTGNAQIAFVIEWSADCNSDGSVDYGQIRRGELADLNGNGVPDVCEISVSGVTPPSVPSQGGSTITIRGTNFQGTPSVKIGGVAATNVVTV